MDFLQTVEADGAAALAWCKTELTYLETEGAAVINWIEAKVPGSANAIGTFIKTAEEAAAEIAKVAANGLSTEVTALTSDMEAVLQRFLQSSGMSANLQNELNSVGISAVQLANTVGQSAVSVALANILAKLAAAAV